jgi:hypothetical protein
VFYKTNEVPPVQISLKEVARKSSNLSTIGVLAIDCVRPIDVNL